MVYRPDNTEKKENMSTISKKDSGEAAAIVQMPTKQMNTFPSSPDNGRLDSGEFIMNLLIARLDY
jgi:hypothetical protein